MTKTLGRGRVVSKLLQSRILKGNPLKDPSERQVLVYLPPGFDEHSGRSSAALPVIYMLAGFTGKGQSYLNYAFGELTLAQRLDRLINSGKLPPTLVVMPDCMTRYGGSQYINSSATGRYEDYLVNEIVPFVDAEFPTLNDRRHRAIAGKSSGGYGALVLAMRHSDVFSACACHSGDMGFDLCYVPEFPTAARLLNHYDNRPARFFAAYDKAEKKPASAYPLIDVIGMSAAYSPNPKRPPPENFDLPFDPVTCAGRPEIWAKWKAQDPLNLIEGAAARRALKKLTALFIDCGSDDQAFLNFGARRLSQRLTALHIKHRYEEFPDGHFNISYRYDVSLPILGKAISQAGGA